MIYKLKSLFPLPFFLFVMSFINFLQKILLPLDLLIGWEGGEETGGTQIFSFRANQITISPKWRKNRRENLCACKNTIWSLVLATFLFVLPFFFIFFIIGKFH